MCAAALVTSAARWRARVKDIAERTPTRRTIAMIEALPDEPRTTDFLIEMLAAANWAGPNSRALWSVVFDRLVASRDVRCVPKLRAFAVTPPRFNQAKLTKWIASECARVADALGPDVVAPVPTQSVDSLLARVWAAPDDLELRAVIGDALQELDDPRGKLIALQCARKPNAKAIKKLVEKHEEHLAGAIALVASHPRSYPGERLTFVLGFLDTCAIGFPFATFRDWDESAVAPHWSTVQRVHFHGETPKRKWFKAWWASGRLGRLRRIEMLGVVLERSDAESAWKITAPRHIPAGDREKARLLITTMPRAELARMKLPAQLQM